VVPFTTLIGQLQSEVDLFEIPFEVLNAKSYFVDIESKFSMWCNSCNNGCNCLGQRVFDYKNPDCKRFIMGHCL
jgi:hypothetical protein